MFWLHRKLTARGVRNYVVCPTRLMAADVPKEVRWAVNDTPSGNGKLGSITAGGNYDAPTCIPPPREIHICAEVPEVATP